jgi:hypothetical protein
VTPLNPAICAVSLSSRAVYRELQQLDPWSTMPFLRCNAAVLPQG